MEYSSLLSGGDDRYFIEVNPFSSTGMNSAPSASYPHGGGSGRAVQSPERQVRMLLCGLGPLSPVAVSVGFDLSQQEEKFSIKSWEIQP